MQDHELFASLRRARTLLRHYGHPVGVRARDLVRWLHTDTPYPNPSFREIVDNPYYTVHELVEIQAARAMGLRLTKDVILRHMQEVNEAHLVAARVEFDVAAGEGAVGHLAMRYRHLKAWCKDPILTPSQRRRYESLRRSTRRRLQTLRRRRGP